MPFVQFALHTGRLLPSRNSKCSSPALARLRVPGTAQDKATVKSTPILRRRKVRRLPAVWRERCQPKICAKGFYGLGSVTSFQVVDQKVFQKTAHFTNVVGGISLNDFGDIAIFFIKYHHIPGGAVHQSGTGALADGGTQRDIDIGVRTVQKVLICLRGDFSWKP